MRFIPQFLLSFILSVAALPLWAQDMEEIIFDNHQFGKIEAAVEASKDIMQEDCEIKIQHMMNLQEDVANSTHDSGGRLKALGELIERARQTLEDARRLGTFEGMERALNQVNHMHAEALSHVQRK